jgi:hypothetical protein
MELMELINHPERLDRDTLYELRSMLALNPYFQTARLLMLQNLYLLHDSAFDEELRRAAFYITDRKTIFNMVEAAHYQLRPKADSQKPKVNNKKSQGSRTIDLIDTFLDSIPTEEEPKDKKRRPTPADAAIDYVAYLLETEGDDDNTNKEDAPQLKGHDLIDNFLQQEQGRIMLSELPQNDSDDNQQDDSDDNDEEYFTETLARIYIRQGRYQKALDIISRLSSKYPQKNAYFADQIRFLEKLIINNNTKLNN